MARISTIPPEADKVRRPKNVLRQVGIHPCRGKFRSTWLAEGGYEPVAEVLFNALNIDAHFLEYDDERSGDFAPLRFVSYDKAVVLRLVTSKVPELELKQVWVHRVKEASHYMPLENMCLSPQRLFQYRPRQLTHQGRPVG
jgi:5-methyltetrahydropteroyltriglutamate--homocysteine methyltransferase